MNETINVLKNRRSCRNFKPDMIKEEELKAIIEAGTYAATGMGKQSPIIIAVTNKEIRDMISEDNRSIGGWDAGFDPFYGAPVILIVLAKKDVATHVYDGALVMGNLMNAAESLGVASIWIHRAPSETGNRRRVRRNRTLCSWLCSSSGSSPCTKKRELRILFIKGYIS